VLVAESVLVMQLLIHKKIQELKLQQKDRYKLITLLKKQLLRLQVMVVLTTKLQLLQAKQLVEVF
jgi:hypothetical protein